MLTDKRDKNKLNKVLAIAPMNIFIEWCNSIVLYDDGNYSNQ